MPSVVFDPVAFVARYPEFSTVSAPTLGDYFTEATMYLDNTDASRVSNLAQRALLLNMLTAHVAALNGSGVNGNGAPGLVGRINSATEGSVSVSAEYATPANGTQAYFQQTQYGAAFWAASARYRTMQYIGRC
jgi:hypothetical protein